MSKIAIVIGATGMVGTELIQQLIRNNEYSEITVFHRRDIGVKHKKVKQHIVDFDQIKEWTHLISGDTLFSCMGTTIKKAGSKESQYKIDVTIPFEFAKTAALNGVKNYVLISSKGANAQSKLFYFRIKGELENKVIPLPFYKTIIVRPSVLNGNRKEYRLAEKLIIKLLNTLNQIIKLPSQQPIHASILSKAMINSVSKAPDGITIFENQQLFEIVE